MTSSPRRADSFRAVQAFVLVLLCLGTFAARAGAADPPTVSGFSPQNGPVGTTVVIDGTGFVPPISITFGGNVPAAGSFTSTQITATVPAGAQTGPILVITGAGSVSTATSFVVGGTMEVPTVTLAATTPTVRVGSGLTGEFTLSLSAAATGKIVVNYTVSGSAVNGTDYARLTGAVKIKPGKQTKTIEIVPQGDLGGMVRKVKLTLAPGTGYTVGTTTVGTVKIKPAD